MAQATTPIASSMLRLSNRHGLFSFFKSHQPQVFIKPVSTFSPKFRNHALTPPNLLTSKNEEETHESNSDKEENFPSRKSRNEMKREARRSVKWGMELAKFSSQQIKRVIRAAELDDDVFDALMLVKRLGPDVREGKRRQFSYIGRLLREAQPELMEALIRASKDGDGNTLQALLHEKSISVEDESEDETTYEKDDSDMHIEVATRWLDGLISKNQPITNEVYSIHNVEFDRQELRKLVRRVQSVQEGLINEESALVNDSKLTKVKKPLLRFLHILARQSLAE